MQLAQLPSGPKPAPADGWTGVATTRPAANADLARDGQRLSHVGRYALTLPLSEDIFGGLYEGWDPLLSRRVVVRTLQFGLKISSRVAVDRLLLDVSRAAGDLHHRHIVAVHDSGLSAHGVYIAMEHLVGRDMLRAFDEGWRPTVAEAIRLARRLADGLAYAHARGVVHGAVEPGNIFITRSGRPKLMNLGIANVIDRGPVPELAEVRLGTPHYQAPERLAAGHCDARTDVYSLGIVLYEMLSGRNPFRLDSTETLRQSIALGRHVPLSDWRPDLPPRLVALIQSAMACDPDDRPASAQALAGALRKLSNIEGQSSDAIADVRRAPSQRRHWAVRWAFPSTTWALVAAVALAAHRTGQL